MNPELYSHMIEPPDEITGEDIDAALESVQDNVIGALDLLIEAKNEFTFEIDELETAIAACRDAVTGGTK